MVIIPIFLRPCFYKAIPWLKEIQMLPRDGKCVSKDFKDNSDQVFSEVAASIYNIVNKWLERMKADNFRGALNCLLTIRCLIFIIQFSARMVLMTIIFIPFLWNQKENR